MSGAEAFCVAVRGAAAGPILGLKLSFQVSDFLNLELRDHGHILLAQVVCRREAKHSARTV